MYTDDPEQVHGCKGCLELVAQDLENCNDYRGHCLHCRQEITAQGGGGVAQDSPEALPVLWEARMVTTSKDTDARRTQRLTTAVFAVCYPTEVTEETLQDTNLTEVNVGAEDATPPFPPATCRWARTMSVITCLTKTMP